MTAPAQPLAEQASVSAFTWNVGLTLTVVALVFALLAATQIPPYLVVLAGVGILLLLGVVSTEQALEGFANSGMVTIALLFVVAAGLRETGVLARMTRLFGRPQSVRAALGRLILPTATTSAFINNTPLVALLTPAVRDWAKRIGVPASKLLIPVSYASILGGMCTLIGTSTNLVVHGLLIDAGLPGLSMFDMTAIGLPCTAIGLLFLWLLGPRLLPDRDQAMTELEDAREFTVEMVVAPGSPLAGKTVEEAGLRHLPGSFLAEIHRQGHILAAVSPHEILADGDQLVFVGLVDSIVDLQRTPGLLPATQQVFKLDAPRSERWFIEAVVSHRCAVVGQTIRRSGFRSRYDAVILAVARGGERVRQKIGDIELKAGDVLLIEAPPSFVENHRNSGDFYLVSRATDNSPPRHDRASINLLIFVGMIALAATQVVSMLEAAAIAAALTMLSGCASEPTIRRAMDWPLLLTIAGSFGLGSALEVSGAARIIAGELTGIAAGNPHLSFAVICLLTVALSELITNNAAAVLCFPIAMQTAASTGASYMPFALGVMLCASAAFATPLGYQTHLMVYGAGGYRFSDFVRIGLPLDILILVAIIILTPLIWPF